MLDSTLIFYTAFLLFYKNNRFSIKKQVKPNQLVNQQQKNYSQLTCATAAILLIFGIISLNNFNGSRASLSKKIYEISSTKKTAKIKSYQF